MGSEMCIRDREAVYADGRWTFLGGSRWRYDNGELLPTAEEAFETFLLYTSDAADDLLCVYLGGRRIIKKQTKDI